MEKSDEFFKKEKIAQKYNVELVKDVLLSPDNIVILMTRWDFEKDVVADVVFGSLKTIGLEDKPQLTFEKLMMHFDDDNAYAEVSGKAEHYAEVNRLLYDFIKRPVVTFPIRYAHERHWIRVAKYPVKKTEGVYSIFISNVTENLIEDEHIFRKTHLDSLTQLFNKYALDYHYGLRYQWENFHVLFLDLDNFKLMNDVKGHPFGNRFLQSFGLLLKSYESEYNHFYRIGGDEFVGLFFKPPHVIKSIAEDLINKLRTLASSAGFKEVSVSMGIIQAEQRDDVIRKADQLLKLVKSQGKNHYRYLTESEQD